MKQLFIFIIIVTTSVVFGGDRSYVIHEDIVYTEPNDTKVKLDVFVPKKEGVYPAVIVIHGGAWKYGSRKKVRGYAKGLTKMGFVCFVIDYRLAPKFKFPAQIDDCRQAVVWVRANAEKYKVNLARIGAIGFSAGGHLASLLATTGEPPSKENGNVDTRIQAAAAGGAPTEFRYPTKGNGEWAIYWMGGDSSSVPEKFHAASSAAFVDKLDAPTFFFNGAEDKVVPVKWTLPCYNALKAAGVKTEMYIVAGAGHGETAKDVTAVTKAFAFLKAELYR